MRFPASDFVFRQVNDAVTGPAAQAEVVELDNAPAQVQFHELVEYLVRQSLGRSGINGGIINQGEQELLLEIETRINQIPGDPVRNYVGFLREVAIAEGVITMIVRIEKIVGRVATSERFHVCEYFPCHVSVDMGIDHQDTVVADYDARIIDRFFCRDQSVYAGREFLRQ